MKKKVVVLLMSLALVGTSLTGCGGSDVPEESSVKEEVSDSVETVEDEEPEAAPAPTPAPAPVEESAPESTPASGIRPEFEQSMASYESFMNEYCDFMMKYAESGGTDLQMLAEYTEYVTKYEQVLKDFEAWEGTELSNEELSYYIDVQTRINKKLLECTN